MTMFVGLVFITICTVSGVKSHGMLMDPVSRNSAWRKGFPTPPDYTDNQKSCGGLGVQWGRNKGKCGACGDPYDAKQRYVHPGKGATGTIVKTYRQGQVITASVRITANHNGWFEFRIGDIGSPPITQAKLNTHLLPLTDGRTRWPLPKGTGTFNVDLKLPEDLVCKHCVFQWWWKCGNNWGCDDTGCGVGKAFQQETFVNCADVTISRDGTTKPPPTQAPETKPPTQAPETKPPTQAPETKPPTQAPETKPPTQAPETKPPTQAPETKPPTQAPETKPPPTQPPPGGECRAAGGWTGNANMDAWCVTNCAANFCPATHCTCA